MRTTLKQSSDTSKVYVWDIVVRTFHWVTALSFVLAYLLEDNRELHKLFGYLLMGALLTRLLWGIIGSEHARFWNFIPSPPKAIKYLSEMMSGSEPRHIGHNPAGAVMIIALISTLSTISATGWMMGLDRYWGEEWVEHLHGNAVNVAIFLIALHLGGVLHSSIKHRENLVKSMLTGWKDH